MSKKQLINLEVEAMVLNSIITSPEQLYTVENFRFEIFTSFFHQDVCKAITSIHSRIGHIDVWQIHCENNKLTLTELSAISTAGIFYSDLEGKIKYLYELYMLRELVKIGTELSYMSEQVNSDPFELNEKAATGLMSILPKTISNTSNMSEYMMEFKKELLDQQSKGGLKGIMSGLRSIDDHTNGWKGGDLVIIAARPSVGKTAIVLKFIQDTLFTQKHNVGMFSLEMSKKSLIQRVISSETGISLSNIVDAKMSESEWALFDRFHATMTDKSNGQLYVNDTTGINVYGIRNAAMAFKAKYDIKLLVVDYLQLVSGMNPKKDTTRQSEVSMISRELKILAKTLDIPVIALSQLSRGVESRGDNKPKLSDLRDSGAIEQDADTVLFLYRANPQNYDAVETINITCEKQRQGHLFEEELSFVKEIVKFKDKKIFNNVYRMETNFSLPEISNNNREREFVDEDNPPF